MDRRILLVPAAASLVSVLQAQPVDLDEERSAWHFRRELSVAAPGTEPVPSFARLFLPPEVAAACQGELRDVRLVSRDGRDVPYVVDRLDERVLGLVWVGRLVDTQSERRKQTVWVVDLYEPRSFDSVDLEISGQDFGKRVRLEVSDDRTSWRLLRADAGVFDRPWGETRPWGERIRQTEISVEEGATARYLRLTADDARSKPIEVRGVRALGIRRLPGAAVRRAVALEKMAAPQGKSRYRLDVEPGFPVDAVEISGDEPAFARRVRLIDVRMIGERAEETTLGDARLYRLRIEDEDLAGESLALAVRTGLGGSRVIEVDNGDSPPLKNLRVTLVSTATSLLFPTVAAPARLYYGNPATRAPVYDLAGLKTRIALSPRFAAATLGPEVANPRFTKSLPLPFAAARGATVDVPKWRAERTLAVTGGDDLYTVTLAAEDLGLVRRDLGDIRIVDAEGRQVPYVLEADAAEERVSLAVESLSSTRRGLSRYRLSVAARFAARPLPLPMTMLDLTFAETFFSRSARLLAAPAPGQRGGDRILFSGTLARSADRGGVMDPSAALFIGLQSQSISVALDREPRTELFLEIDEGDNAPLTLSAASGVVEVPRLAFKAGAGAYRLLLSNAGAAPPRYDIGALRREILAYSAIPLTAVPAAASPSFRRQLSEYFSNAPPTLILWGTIVAAIVVLLLLTAKILKRPEA
jgi:hypothetical protein